MCETRTLELVYIALLSKIFGATQSIQSNAIVETFKIDISYHFRFKLLFKRMQQSGGIKLYKNYCLVTCQYGLVFKN